MRKRFALDLADCQNAMEAGLAYAEARDWRITIAIVDDAGVPLLVSRMDEASPASVDGAIEKARSAALTGVATKLMEAMIAERPAVATMNRVAVEGGIPVLHDGQRLGGIGASGLPSHMDAEVAQVALDALAERLAP